MNKNIQSTNIIKNQNAWLKYNFVNFDVNTYLGMTTTLTATTTTAAMLPFFESLLCARNYTKDVT